MEPWNSRREQQKVVTRNSLAYTSPEQDFNKTDEVLSIILSISKQKYTHACNIFIDKDYEFTCLLLTFVK